MKQSEHKIFLGGEEFVSLVEAAKKFAFSLKYLVSMSQKGQLKVFKMGDYWYTCEKWIIEHKKQLASLIEKEVKEQEDNLKHINRWVKKIFK